MQERFIKRLMSKMKCSVCGQRYETGNVHVLGHQDDLWFLSVACSSCHTQGLVAAVIREGKPAQLVTDLTQEELAKFRDSEAVGIDDVLDIHNFLKNFGGDFSHAFAKE